MNQEMMVWEITTEPSQNKIVLDSIFKFFIFLYNNKINILMYINI